MIWTSDKFGFDVSVWQDNNQTPARIDFQKMRNYGASFVVIRSSVGNLIDEDYQYNITASKGILPRAVYHYWWGSVSPEVQAQTIITALQGQSIEGRVWLDLESNSGGLYSYPTYWRRCCELIEAAGYRTGIYTGYFWWEENAVKTQQVKPDPAADLSYFYARPLWQAWYTSNPLNVLVAGKWGRMMIWQDGTPAIGPEVGVESPTIDHNQWNASYSFETEWGTVAPQPPTGETPMLKGVLVPTTSALNVRLSPISGAVITTLKTGDTAFGAIDTATGWLKVAEILRAAGTRETFTAAYCSANPAYITLTEYTPPPPPATDGIKVIVTEGGVSTTYEVKGTVTVA